jgi:mannose-6-phosphate isomerase
MPRRPWADDSGVTSANLSTPPYPLLCAPVLLEKVWGGDALASFGKAVAPGATIGESWEVADLASTSASGAGGGSIVSRITNGDLAGKNLHDALTLWGRALVGPIPAQRAAHFPMLVKFLDARENLSIQVHPSPAFAARNPGAHLKTECWTILAAKPGSKIYAGLKDGVMREDLVRAVRGGRVLDVIQAHDATVGACFNLPSGTLHALGAGVLVAEVQTPSDTTFRVDDWGRQGRALHIEEALQCIDVAPAPPPIALGDGTRGLVLITEFFTVARLRIEANTTRALGVRDRCAVCMVLAGDGVLTVENETGAREILTRGSTCVVPAGISAQTSIASSGDGLDVLVATLASS